MEPPLQLKNALAKGIAKSLEDIKTFKTGIQDDLDHQIANICFKTLRYIDKNYGKDIYSDTAITDNNKISNIKKLLIYIFIIFYFHSENDDIRNGNNFIMRYERKINEKCELWFEKNKYATNQNSIGTTTTYRPFKKTLEDKDTKATDRYITHYKDNNKTIIFNNDNLQKLIANAVVSIHKNDYKILTALLSDTYDVSSDKFAIYLKHPNAPNKMIFAEDLIRQDLRAPIDLTNNDIFTSIVDNHIIDNILFDNTYKLVYNGKYIKVLDFMPVKIRSVNQNQILNIANIVILNDIREVNLKLVNLDDNDPKKKYFSHKLVQDNDAQYEHQFNNNATTEANSLKFELYVINESQL